MFRVLFDLVVVDLVVKGRIAFSCVGLLCLCGCIRRLICLLRSIGGLMCDSGLLSYGLLLVLAIWFSSGYE